MGNLAKRLERLETATRSTLGAEDAAVRREALRRLSDEDLVSLEDGIEEALERGMKEAAFEDLYAAVSERSRRAMDAYFDHLDAWREGREPPEVRPRDPPGGERNAYRIWKYKKK